MKICFCHIDWAAVSAISNIIIALIALATLIYSIYLLVREKNRRIEDVRARLDCSLIKYMNAYYLLIENIGKEAAYDVKISVKGKVIEEGLYGYVRDTFLKLANTPLIMKGGEKKYFFLCPDRLKRDIRCYWRKTESISDINQWVDAHEEDEISVYALYNKRFELIRSFCIKNFNFIGEIKILNPIEQISGAISDMDNLTLNDIKQQLCFIGNSLEEIKQNDLYKNE